MDNSVAMAYMSATHISSLLPLSVLSMPMQTRPEQMGECESGP
jgi:hypothetical protein